MIKLCCRKAANLDMDFDVKKS